MMGMEEIEKWLEGQSQLFLVLAAIILFSLGLSIGCLIQSCWSMVLAALLQDKSKKKHTVMSYLHHASLDILQSSNGNTNKSDGKRSTDLSKVDAKKWCQDFGVEALTAYAFSTENWHRDEKEIQVLMSLFIKYAESFREEAMKRNIRVKIISTGTADHYCSRASCAGVSVLFVLTRCLCDTDFGRLPQAVQTAVRGLEECSAKNTGFLVNFCLSYGAHGEIVQAVQRLCMKVQNGEMTVDAISEETVTEELLVGPPDCLIRTSGEFRLSNFLLWQMAYTELFFVDKYWPQLTKQDLEEVLLEYVHRQRRFGA
eukprot:scaffold17_cov187-Ochromonas_danica.AAC.7